MKAHPLVVFLVEHWEDVKITLLVSPFVVLVLWMVSVLGTQPR